MRAIIASDLHGSYGSLQFLQKKVDEFKPDMLILLGDLVYHGPRNPLPHDYDTAALINNMPSFNQIPCPITCVRGNCDAEVDIEQMPFAMPESAWIAADGLRIFVTHGHRLPSSPPIPNMPKGSVILRGHTHIPRGETLDDIHIWNPGSLSLPKGGYPPSYAVLENGLFRVLTKDGQEILRHKPA